MVSDSETGIFRDWEQFTVSPLSRMEGKKRRQTATKKLEDTDYGTFRMNKRV